MLSKATGEYRPDYIIKDCHNNGIYKVIKFKRTDHDFIFIDKEEQKENTSKLYNNLCRARSTVVELAMCNEWEWFCNFTLDAEKYDRNDLEKFSKDISRWFRNQRQKFKTKFQYLLIPEQHKDGAWHMHGLLNGVPYNQITDFIHGVHPENLIRAGYKNFPLYAEKFGFISMGRIKDKFKCSLYITKYITKDLNKRMFELGSHLHYNSQKLQRYENVSFINGDVPELDKLLVNKGEFCSTGFVVGEVETFGLRYDDSIVFKEKQIVKE